MLPLILRTAATVAQAASRAPAAVQVLGKAVAAIPAMVEGVSAAMDSAKKSPREQADDDASDQYNYLEDVKQDSKAKDARDDAKARAVKARMTDAQRYQKGWDEATKND